MINDELVKLYIATLEGFLEVGYYTFGQKVARRHCLGVKEVMLTHETGLVHGVYGATLVGCYETRVVKHQADKTLVHLQQLRAG